MSSFQDLSRRLRKVSTPATWVILGFAMLVWLLGWFTHGLFGLRFAFDSTFEQPWGILTYPFASYGLGVDFIWALPLFYWFWWIGSDTERSLGLRRFIGLFAVSAIAGLVFLTFGGMLLNRIVVEPAPNLSGLQLACAALTVAWGIRNKTTSIRMFGVFPISGWVMVWITVGIVLFGYSGLYHAPVMGLFACLHLGLAYVLAEGRLPGRAGPSTAPPASPRFLKAQERQSQQYYDDVARRLKEREERAKLKKLFEGSLKDEPPKDE